MPDNPRLGRQDLFPPIEPYQSGPLVLDRLHSMYWEQSGNPAGTPVVFLHGGPGAGATPTHRRFFDPNFYRIVVFDQRGSGRSTPLGETRDNDLGRLIADIERLRIHLGIQRWLVFGGSWGSTLALAYAEAFPERCLGLVLRGVFLCRQSEINWFLYGMRAIFPEAWRTFSGFVPESERGDLLAAYYRRLTSEDPTVRLAAAKIWSGWEGATSKLLPDPAFTSHYQEDEFALAFARIEAHYFTNKGFLKTDGQLLHDASRIRHIPGVIVQGRYDVVCPMESAWALHRAWPEAERLQALPPEELIRIRS